MFETRDLSSFNTALFRADVADPDFVFVWPVLEVTPCAARSSRCVFDRSVKMGPPPCFAFLNLAPPCFI